MHNLFSGFTSDMQETCPYTYKKNVTNTLHKECLWLLVGFPEWDFW